MSSERLPDDGKFVHGDCVSVLARWVVTTPRCDCKVWVGLASPDLEHVGFVTERCSDEHEPLTQYTRLLLSDRMPRTPADADMCLQDAEKVFYSRASMERSGAA